MTSRMLPMIWANASMEIEESLPMMAGGRVDPRRVLSFCRSYRRRAISSLFLDGQTGPFYDDLQRSGTAFREFLETAADDSKVTSQSVPLMDAIVAGDEETAAAIARHSRVTWNPDYEYEDDFLYMTFLMGRFFLDHDISALDSTLARYETVLDGGEDVRLDLCRAIMEGDDDAFDEALLTLLDSHGRQYREGMEADELIEDDWATEGYLCIEGLALVRLARRGGINPDWNYRFVPSIVHQGQASSFDANSWKSPD